MIRLERYDTKIVRWMRNVSPEDTISAWREVIKRDLEEWKVSKELDKINKKYIKSIRNLNSLPNADMRLSYLI